MLKVIQSSSGPLTSYPATPEAPSVSAPKTKRIISAESYSEQIVKDVCFGTSVSANTVDDADVFSDSLSTDVVALSPEVATVNGRKVSGVASGVAKFKIKKRRVWFPFEIEIVKELSETETTDKSFVSGSLGAHCEGAVSAMLLGKAPSDSTKKIFNGAVNQPLTKNQNLWCADLFPELSCCSVSQSLVVNMWPKHIVMVTKRHGIGVTHYPPSQGQSMTFMDASGILYQRTIVGVNFIPECDICVVRFNEDVPEGIQPCLVAPTFTELSQKASLQRKIPCLGLDREGKVLVFGFGNWIGSNMVTNQHSKLFPQWGEVLISGDSGRQCFLVVNGKLVLIMCWTGGDAGNGFYLGNYISEINAAIVTLDTAAGQQTGYTCSVVDLSAFPSY